MTASTNPEKKYELVAEDTIEVFGIKLFRVRSTRTFGEVEAGDLGGYVASEENLSQEGKAWVSGEARVSGKAWVFGEAWVFGKARVSGEARVNTWEWHSPLEGVEIPLPTWDEELWGPQPSNHGRLVPKAQLQRVEEERDGYKNVQQIALAERDEAHSSAEHWRERATQAEARADALNGDLVDALDRCRHLEGEVQEAADELDKAKARIPSTPRDEEGK